MSVLEEVRRNPAYKSIWFDRNALMNSIGIDLDNRQYIDLTKFDVDFLYDLLVKSLMWMETISETLATAKKLRNDKELEADTLYNQALSRTDAKKVTEAKAEASADPAYVSAKKGFNTLYAYVDYLERLLVNLDKYHYTIKSKIEQSRNIERKY
jgi:hypothetical protein